VSAGVAGRAAAGLPLAFSVPRGTTPRIGVGASVHVPATSANLGPGFDALGLALAYGDELVASVTAGSPVGDAVLISGEGEGCLPTDGSHLAARTIREAWDAWGVDHSGVALSLSATNRTPHGRGQGSSAAVIVAALTAAAALLPEELRPSRDDVFELAARIEGHPDNVAPAVYGGLTISWGGEGDAAAPAPRGESAGGRAFRTAVLTPHEDLVALVAIPDVKLATALARGLLPEQLPHAAAAANSGRAALLIHALTAAPELLGVATEDRLHESFRAPAMPASAALIGALRRQGFAATVSGAGPTVLVLARRGAEAEAALAELTRLSEGDGPTRIGAEGERVSWRVLEPGLDTAGATVNVHRVAS
jgi:homoserine kinase